jgi:hypothetical protein
VESNGTGAMREQKTEFEKFDTTMRKLIAVPHSEIKSKIDAEKAAKKKRKVKKPSASRDSSDREGA